MTVRYFAALIGFAFVAAWIGLGFGYALLCLIGAGAFFALAAVFEGDVDLGELQSRVTQRPASTAPAASAKPTRHKRVQ